MLYFCVGGHDKCPEMLAGPECPYCERVREARPQDLIPSDRLAEAMRSGAKLMAEYDVVAPDRVSEAVRADLLRRSVHGWRKYGAGLDSNPAPLADALKHAYEEALDLATYLKWSILKLEGSDLLAPDPTRGTGLGVSASSVRRCQGGAVGAQGECRACFASMGEVCLSPAAG